MEEPIVKACKCGRTYTREQWEKLPDKKVYTLDWGEVHDQRNCACHSTIVLVLKEGWPEVPDAQYFYENAKLTCVEARVRGYPVHFYRGVDHWRVCVLGEKGTDGSHPTQTVPFITPHVFECPEHAHAWFLRWLEGDRDWNRSWGLPPQWPLTEQGVEDHGREGAARTQGIREARDSAQSESSPSGRSSRSDPAPA